MVLQKKDKYHVAIVGATGAVGIEMLQVLASRHFPVGQLTLLASKNSVGVDVVHERGGRGAEGDLLGAAQGV